jgi:hypothetical protein
MQARVSHVAIFLGDTYDLLKERGIHAAVALCLSFVYYADGTY